MPKIRQASKSGTLEVSLARQMQADGFTKGKLVEWLHTEAGWILKLTNSAVLGVQVDSDAQVATEQKPEEKQAEAAQV